MQTNNNTREMLGQLSQAASQIAAGFDRAADLGSPVERREAMHEALNVLREMRHAVLVVGAQEGEVWTFNPDGDDVNICENCGKTLDAHIGDNCKCP